MSVDGALHIARFPAELQPGIYVKRIHGTDQEATAEELVRYYSRKLDEIGGESAAVWEGSLVLAVSTSKLLVHTFHFQTIMTSRRKGEIRPGSPLDVLTIDPATEKYYSEMSWAERKSGVDVQEIFAFVAQHMDDL
ncbi:MAG: hypothetical protein HC802_20640 [Caldilineaceae bacterium]|nr:hypothetical protein [Caldilineaceae bacterium]